MDEGRITAFILPGDVAEANSLGFSAGKEEIIVPWEKKSKRSVWMLFLSKCPTLPSPGMIISSGTKR